MRKRTHDFSTRLVHEHRDPAKQQGFVNPPVYHGSTVVFPTLDAYENAWTRKHAPNEVVYGRRGTPTSFALENAVASLENGHAALAVSSGLAAVSTSLMGCLKSGDHLLMVDTVYGPGRVFCDEVLVPYGVDVEYYDPLIGNAIESLIRTNTACIYMESPGSLTFEVQDIPAIVEVARKHSVTTIMDNSWATAYYFKPLDHGINICVLAATKYIVGHSDAMLGLVVADEEHYPRMRKTKDYIGHHSGPDDVYLGLRGLRTLSIRMDHHQEQGLRLASWLKRQPEVTRVLHPAFPECPGHQTWKRDFTGSSGLFSFEIARRPRASMASFLDNLELFSMGASWGAFESLIIPADPAATRSATGWQSEGQLFRVHAGMENIDDLIADLDAGLERYRST